MDPADGGERLRLRAGGDAGAVEIDVPFDSGERGAAQQLVALVDAWQGQA